MFRVGGLEAVPKIADLGEAWARFEELIADVEAGLEVVICRDGAPVARLIPVDVKRHCAETEEEIETIRASG